MLANYNSKDKTIRHDLSWGYGGFVALIILLMVLPPLVPGTSFRVDTLLIYIVVPFLVLGLGVIKYRKEVRPVILAFAVLFAGVFLTIILQALFIDIPLESVYITNGAGYLRPLLFALLASLMIRTEKQVLLAAGIILFGIIIHQFGAIIDYFSIRPISKYVNLMYRGDQEQSGGVRTLGLFNRVHGLAYFSLYGMIFSLSIYMMVRKSTFLYYVAILAAMLSIVGVILPYSRGAWIATAVSVSYLMLMGRGWKPLLASVIVVISMTITVIVMEIEAFNRIKSVLVTIVEGVRYLINPDSVHDLSNVRFITGRLEWGWVHAIEAWKAHPLIGDLSAGLNVFIGDGGYTEILVKFGVIGLFSLLSFLAILWFGVRGGGQKNSNQLRARASIRSFVLAIIFANLATGFMKERSLELLPIMLVVVIMLGSMSFKKPAPLTSHVKLKNKPILRSPQVLA